MLTPVSDEPLFARPQFVTSQPFIFPRPKAEVKLSPSADSKALPLEWILDPDKKGSTTDRILARIVQSIAHEPDVWLRDDYRQAFVCVSLAERGNPSPFIQSSYVCYGIHPDKLWPAILAKREAKLGREYSEWYDQAGNLKADSQISAAAGHAGPVVAGQQALRGDSTETSSAKESKSSPRRPSVGSQSGPQIDISQVTQLEKKPSDSIHSDLSKEGVA